MSYMIRMYDPENDHNFILNSWLKSYRYNDASQAISIPKEIYYTVQAALIHKLLINYPTFVMCDESDPSIIWGYINFETESNTVNYIYMKSAFRRLNLASKLLSDAGIDKTSINTTHLTSMVDHRNLIYNPYKELIN